MPSLSRLTPFKYPCWIFDMDGTLTIPQHDFAAIRRKLKIPTNDDILKNIAQRPDADREQAQKELYEWELDLAHRAQANPDALRLIEHLFQHNYALGVLTRNLTELAHITLNTIGMAQYFAHETILGRDVAEPKPSPEGIQIICSHHSIPSNQTVMVGDYIHDTQAGRAAGSLTILIDSENRFSALSCTDIHIHSLAELPFHNSDFAWKIPNSS